MVSGLFVDSNRLHMAKWAFWKFLDSNVGAFAYCSNRFCSVMTYSRNLKQNTAHSIQHESFSNARGYLKSTKNNRQSTKKKLKLKIGNHKN